MLVSARGRRSSGCSGWSGRRERAANGELRHGEGARLGLERPGRQRRLPGRGQGSPRESLRPSPRQACLSGYELGHDDVVEEGLGPALRGVGEDADAVEVAPPLLVLGPDERLAV
jgi:hypothetical protein